MTMMTQVKGQHCHCNYTVTNYYTTVQYIQYYICTCINSQHHPQLNSNININDINIRIYTRHRHVLDTEVRALAVTKRE